MDGNFGYYPSGGGKGNIYGGNFGARNEESNSESSVEQSDFSLDEDTDDEDFFEENRKKNPKKSNLTKSRLSNNTRAPRTNFDKQFSLDNTQIEAPRRSHTSKYTTDDSDSESPEYSDGIESWNSEEQNETSEDADSSDSDGERGKSSESKKEEYTGPQVERIIGCQQDPDDPPKFYIKYKNRSYVHCKWKTEEEINDIHNGKFRLIKFKKDVERGYTLLPSPTIPNLQTLQDEIFCPEFLEVSRIIAQDPDKGYFVKWENLGYENCTWETEIEDNYMISEYEERENAFEEVRNMPAPIRPPPSAFKHYGEGEGKIPIPEFKGEHELRDYQVEGLNWLRYCWYHHRSSILADEMGLGKTVMGVTMINELRKLGFRGPFLVLAPLSTLTQWEREFRLWTDLNVINYSGNKEAREIIEKYELYWGENREVIKFEVILINYERLDILYDFLNQFKWVYMIADEAHVLKNHKTKRYELIEGLNIDHKLLMTGTPIQNRMEEIWSLLHLIDPTSFRNLEDFMDKYGNVQEEGAAKLTEFTENVLQKYMLHRIKHDVEKSIGAKEETIIEVELTRTQKLIYRMLLDNKAGELMNHKELPAMNNLVMQLRKVCNHPSLIKISDTSYPESERDDNKYQQMVKCCGKLLFVDKLLAKIFPTGAKVLIFSQMTAVLDLFEDYCYFRGFRYERIDGSVIGNRRQAAIDRFNNPENGIFIFLLCTRAGGVGLNLTAANTVIIYDSDWNPQNDIQAQARCHRIGQKNKVQVYRLITRNTYESEMFQRASRKLGLDQALLYKNTSNDNKNDISAEEIDKLLRKGAYHLLMDDDQELDSFISEDIDQILAKRSKVVQSNEPQQGENVLSKAKFGTGSDLDINDDHFWEKFNPQASQMHQFKDVVFNKREKKQNTKYNDSDDDFQQEEIWTKRKRDDILKALQKFGFTNRWPQIVNDSKFQGGEAEARDACIILISFLTDNPDTLKFFTGQDALYETQRALLRTKVFTDKEFYAKITTPPKPANVLRRLFFIHLLQKWNGESIPKVKIPESIPWKDEYDKPLLEGVWKHGWGSWQKIFSDGELFIDEMPPASPPFLTKRLEALLKHLSTSKGVTPPEELKSIKINNEKHQKHDKGDSRKKIKKPEKQLPPPADQEKINQILVITKALTLFGYPNTPQIWELFHSYVKMEDATQLTKKIINKSKDLLRSSSRDPSIEFKDAAFKETLKYELADQIMDTIRWMSTFRKFYVNKFPNVKSKLSTLKSKHDFWKHEDFDPVLFDHLNLYGFSQPSNLLIKQPFFSAIPDKFKNLVKECANSEKADNQPVDFTDFEPLAFISSPEKLRAEVQSIMHDLTFDKTEQIVIQINKKKTQSLNLPMIIDEIMIESLGTGKFSCTNGYLYRTGFRAHLHYGSRKFITYITDSNYAPFEVEYNGEKTNGPSIPELWQTIFGDEKFEGDPYMKFGIGIPLVRFWMQKQLGSQKLLDYKMIIFEDPKEAQANEDKASNPPPSVPMIPKARRKPGAPFPPLIRK